MASKRACPHVLPAFSAGYRVCVPTDGGRVPTVHPTVGVDRELKPNFPRCAGHHLRLLDVGRETHTFKVAHYSFPLVVPAGCCVPTQCAVLSLSHCLVISPSCHLAAPAGCCIIPCCPFLLELTLLEPLTLDKEVRMQEVWHCDGGSAPSSSQYWQQLPAFRCRHFAIAPSITVAPPPHHGLPLPLRCPPPSLPLH